MTNPIFGTSLASVAALIGDVARANILSALMDGKALTAGELTWHAGVGAATTSGHLGKLLDAGLVAVEKQGRHRYYRLASAEIAQAIETLMIVASSDQPTHKRRTGPKDEAMRLARTCYDHMAGRLGVAVASSLTGRGHVILGDGAGVVTDDGWRFLSRLGIDDARTPKGGGRRPICRTCLDWSERRPHIGGWLGAALLERSIVSGWIARTPHSRALTVTPAGVRAYPGLFPETAAIFDPPA